LPTNDTINQIYPKVLLNQHLVYCFWRETDLNLFAKVFDFNDPAVGVSEEKLLKEDLNIRLSQCYPNPFNSTTTIQFFNLDKKGIFYYIAI